MHWLLDVEFKHDRTLSRYRAGHGAKNMAVVRRFALELVRGAKTKGSIKQHAENAPAGARISCCTSSRSRVNLDFLAVGQKRSQ